MYNVFMKIINSFRDIRLTKRESARKKAILLLKKNDIFGILKEVNRLAKKWSYLCVFYNSLFDNCKSKKQAILIHNVFQKNKPKCFYVFINELVKKEKQMLNKFRID